MYNNDGICVGCGSGRSRSNEAGLFFIRSLGCTKIHIQTDSLIVAEALNKNEGYSLVAAPILNECRSLLKDFGKVYIEHCNRESNTVAHELASFERNNPPSVWLDTPPS